MSSCLEITGSANGLKIVDVSLVRGAINEQERCQGLELSHVYWPVRYSFP